MATNNMQSLYEAIDATTQAVQRIDYEWRRGNDCIAEMTRLVVYLKCHGYFSLPGLDRIPKTVDVVIAALEAKQTAQPSPMLEAYY